MMAEAVDWDDLAMVSEQPPADETWHVAVAPDDIKVVSLEQLDDMFRLSLVDSETKVWQPGMSEWVSLGVIAGLEQEQEQEPPPPPQRSHPKPPAPRSAPPPPRVSAAPPAPRSAPPAPRSAPPAPRSAPPSPRSAPPAPRVSAAPAPFYAEPLAPASYAPTMAPVQYTLPPTPSLAPIASVRPLVVSRNPYPMPRQGGGGGRVIVGLSLLAGVAVTLYRNDVLRDAAHSLHQDGLYAQLEQRLGGPAFGTLRAVEQNETGQAAAALTLGSVTGGSERTASTAAALASAVQAPTPSQTAAPSTGSSPPVVSLESLGTERGAKAKAEAAAAAPAPMPVAKAASSFVSAPVAKAAARPPAAKATPVEKPAPQVATKPESEMTPRERLNAAIAHQMAGGPAPAKKSGKGGTGLKGSGEYDPLNPKL